MNMKELCGEKMVIVSTYTDIKGAKCGSSMKETGWVWTWPGKIKREMRRYLRSGSSTSKYMVLTCHSVGSGRNHLILLAVRRKKKVNEESIEFGD